MQNAEDSRINLRLFLEHFEKIEKVLLGLNIAFPLSTDHGHSLCWLIMTTPPTKRSRDNTLEEPRRKRMRPLKWTEYVIFGDPTFIVCIIGSGLNEEPEAAAREALATALGADHSCSFVWVNGKYCLSMQSADRALAYPAMTVLLHLGHTLYTQNRMPINISASDLPDDVQLTPTFLELYHIREQRKECGDNVKKAEYLWDKSGQICYHHKASWLTQEGRDFVDWLYNQFRAALARYMYTTLNEEPKVYSAESNDEEVPDEEPSDEEVANAEEDDDDDGEEEEQEEVAVIDEDSVTAALEAPQACVVCMDARANTLVLPCMHCVACMACSKRLKDTDNRDKCIVCRQRIEEICADAEPI